MLPMIMNTFNDKLVDPDNFCAQNVPTIANASTQVIVRQIEPVTYVGLICTIVALSVVVVLLLGYITWNHITSRRHCGQEDATKGHSPDIERGTKAYHRTPETPDTVVGIDGSKHLCMSRDNNSSQESCYKGVPFKFFVSSPDDVKTLAEQPVSAFDLEDEDEDNRTSRPLEMNVGNKLRSHPMIRETTGNIPPLPAETERNEFIVLTTTTTTTANTTLGLEGHDGGQRCHSRSSLYTIAEAETEASCTSSQEPTSPIVTAMSIGLTHAGLASVPL